MTWRTWAWKNPIIVKEFRTRMRGYRAFVLLTAHLLFLLSVLGMAYLVFRSSSSYATSLEEQRIFGKAVFGLLIWMELITISFIAPALTSGAISSEREHQTFDLLRVTLLPVQFLVFGKYASGLLFIFLLLFTSIPLQGPAFLFGSVLPEEILIGLLVLVVTAITFCAVGIFFSSLITRTLISTVLSYAFAIFLVFGIPIIALILIFLFGIIPFSLSQFSLATQILLIASGWLLVSITPLGTIIATEIILIEEGSAFLVNIPITDQVGITMPSPWLPHVLINLLLSSILIWLSIRITRRTEN